MKKTPKTTQPDLSPEISNLKASLAEPSPTTPILSVDLANRVLQSSNSRLAYRKLLDLRDHLEMASGQIKDQS
jgi:hypothetical protein